MSFKYGNISGYHPRRFEDIDLESHRTGLSPTNPAGALLLVKRIDELEAELQWRRQHPWRALWRHFFGGRDAPISLSDVDS